ncbi:MAG: hypothetical protein R3E62_10705 [Pseudomonadales bacterium]
MRDDEPRTTIQLRHAEEEVRRQCREKGIVYHYDPEIVLEDAPKGNGRGMLEYRGVLIKKLPHTLTEMIGVMDWVRLPYGSKQAIEKGCSGMWQLRDLTKRIDGFIDNPPKREANAR